MAYLIQHLLSESAQRYPHHEAARFKQQSMTYRQLDEITNRVAHALQREGVRRGDRVGIYVHKSFASLVAIFGILKAGGVYVPLDPNAPAKRLAYITRNCDIRVVLSATNKLRDLDAMLEYETPVGVVMMTDQDAQAPAQLNGGVRVVPWYRIMAEPPTPPPDPGVIETDLAYILYTSGSTGVPKGVMISHRTIFTFINWCSDTFNITANDRLTSHAPLHFDLSTFDIFVAMQAGATVVLVPEQLSIFPVQLVRLLQDERITVTYLVPSVLSMMVNYGQLPKHDLSALRLVLFAGEVFPIKYLRQLVNMVPHPDYYNLYGPTETNVCTYYKVQPTDIAPDRTRPVPIGKACENMEVFAVKDDGTLVTEPGEEGELWVRGSCVAQGYWGDPEKTARSFVRNPYQPFFEETAYRTGDIVVLAEDRTNWIYIGRRDHMIKSRGYRIELGEIEAALYAHPHIKEAAVVAIPDDLIGNRLDAYIVPEDGYHLSADIVRAHCAQHLPRYMIPERIELLATLPKTSTGKTDRTGLKKMAMAAKGATP